MLAFCCWRRRTASAFCWLEEGSEGAAFHREESGQICVFSDLRFSASSISAAAFPAAADQRCSSSSSSSSNSSRQICVFLQQQPAAAFPATCSSLQQRTACAAAAFPAAAVGDSDLQFPDQRFQPAGADSDIVFRHRTCTLVEKGVLEVRVSAANHVYIRDSGGARGRSTPSLWIN